MKRSTSFVAVALAAMALAAPAKAQLMFDWDENNQFTFYATDLVCEGGVTYDEDEGGFVMDGTPGRILINIPEGSTMDWSEVARIEVHGTLEDENGESKALTEFAWSDWDPLATFTVCDRDIVDPNGNNVVNTWMGSRYSVNFAAVGDKEYHNGRTYAAMSAKVIAAYWGTRDSYTEDSVLVAKPGIVYIDDIVFTKTIEQDPQAITGAFWHEWDAYDETGNILASDLAYCGVQLNTALGAGSPFAGVLNGMVPGNVYADLTQYAGFYVKGTPGTPFRGLFNRQSLEDAGDYVNFVRAIDDEGEMTVLFTDEDFVEAFENAGITNSYIHLNTVKINWGAPDGAKITKFNYIEAGEDGISSVAVDANTNGAMYNIYGQQVNKSYKGLVIKNGKKFINK